AGPSIPTLRIDPAIEAAQVARLREVRATRNAAAAAAAISRVEECARSGENLMPPILAAVESYATVGEVADALRRVFGEYSEAG
ncbi:MAG: methylmalonyl-CoA mutase, partial [Acidobacteria bacterium]|nr:methylmalonyl-CoA mutase [Acidobacteriota bacterium]